MNKQAIKKTQTKARPAPLDEKKLEQAAGGAVWGTSSHVWENEPKPKPTKPHNS